MYKINLKFLIFVKLSGLHPITNMHIKIWRRCWIFHVKIYVQCKYSRYCDTSLWPSRKWILKYHSTYNTRNRNIPTSNIKQHTNKLYNTSFLTKAYTSWTKQNNNIKLANTLKCFLKRYTEHAVNAY